MKLAHPLGATISLAHWPFLGQAIKVIQGPPSMQTAWAFLEFEKDWLAVHPLKEAYIAVNSSAFLFFSLDSL